MSKREKKSIVDLMNNSEIEEIQVEKAVEQIHKMVKPKKEKTVRVTVDTPESLHKNLKKLVIDESLDLKTFFLQAVEEKYERMKS